MKAVFFDRDGTLIIDKHYLSNPEEVQYFEYTFPLLKKLQEQNYKLFIVTNQSGIGRGYFTEQDMNRVHTKISIDFQRQGIEITEIVFCPHHPAQNCQCRKPSPKLINNLIEKYSIDSSQSFMVGDKDIDVEAGNKAGVKGMLIQDFLQKYHQ